MKKLRLLLGIFVCPLVFVLGCTTTGTTPRDEVEQFEPVPRGRVGKQELPSVPAKRATDLLRAAGEAFRKANDAQENGDEKTALRHYGKMLQLLQEAELDPAIFYNLRPEFERILGESIEQAGLLDERGRLKKLTPEEMAEAGLGGGIEIPFPLPERVLAEIEEIQQIYSRNFQNGLNRSAKYLPHLRRELRLAGLPEELVWLAMVESQFHPTVVSPAGAAGMWQFMRATGRHYNLRVDSYVDERFNWRKETNAAVAYLTTLRDFFEGDWPLAITAYNMGEHGVEQVIAMNGGERDLWKLLETAPGCNRMARESRKFYAKFLATVIVGQNPEKYGFTVPEGKPEDVDMIPIEGSYSLASLEKAAGWQEGVLRELNRDLVRGITPPTGEHLLAVPKRETKTLLAALKTTPKVRPNVHLVRRGETPGGIANRYGVSVRELMAVNKIRSPRHLQIGKELIVPGTGSAPVSTAGSAGTQRTYAARSYRVRKGDTLSDIATKYGVKISDIQAWNGMGRKTRIQVGTSLKMAPPGAQVASASETSRESGKVHVVRAGEFPAKIAKQYGVGLEDFLRWNRLSKTSMIHVGDKLVVHGGKKVAAAGSEATEKLVYTVQAGDSASVIADKHGVGLSDLLKWNGLTRNSTLPIGKKLVIHKSAAASQDTAKQEVLVHKVQKGQNPTTIARRYGVSVNDLLKWNGWDRNCILRVGDAVTIRRN
ncbi:MAG: LysM peptidoglycan-binding domain-containing protein [Candidatus Hydrogenedentota bacterium]